MSSPLSSRSYVWSFVGQKSGKPTREAMLSEMSLLPWNSFTHLTEIWDDPQSLSASEVKAVYSNSIFVPCPRGNDSLDSFRVWEALEAGALPIVEKDEGDYFHQLLGANCLIQAPPDWSGVAADIDMLLKRRAALDQLYDDTMKWWEEYKKSLKSSVSLSLSPSPISPSSPSFSSKTSSFLDLRDEWIKFKDFEFFNYISSSLASSPVPSERFSCYNPGHSLAIVSLYTPEISDYAIESEMNIRAYCEKQGYTFYVYRETLDRESHGNWSKPKALLNHIDDHEAVIWMDSDTLIFNDSKRFEEILERCVPMKKIIACEDVGSNNKQLPQGSILNSGVVIFRRHQYTKNLLERWWDFRKNHDTSSLYASGGDQEVLINILKESDGFGYNRKIFPMNTFNTDPRLIDEETFIIHFMAYPFSLKKIFMKYWNS